MAMKPEPSLARLRLGRVAAHLESARCREGGTALAMLVPGAEQDWPPRRRRAGASHDTLVDHARGSDLDL
jgi:hypothetical protein